RGVRSAAAPSRCRRRAASPGGASIAGGSSWTVPAPATPTRTGRTAATGATSATRLIGAGAGGSGQRIEHLHGTAPSRDLERGGDAPGVGGEHGHGADRRIKAEPR